jgi:hypothetical protein
MKPSPRAQTIADGLVRTGRAANYRLSGGFVRAELGRGFLGGDGARRQRLREHTEPGKEKPRRWGRGSVATASAPALALPCTPPHRLPYRLRRKHDCWFRARVH